MNFEKPYTIHITRRELWSDKKNYNAISLREWIDYVNRDHQMALVNEIEIPLRWMKLGDTNIIYRSEGLSFWKVHSFEGKMYCNTWFEYERGNIDVSNPNDEIIKKMIAIAGRLEAKVQGDNGEIYDYNYFPIATKKPWWKFW